jgi:quinolinate synthase
MSILEEALQSQQQLPHEYRSMGTDEMENRVHEIKKEFGERVYIPGHHYQKDEVIQFADDTGDSLKLAQLAAQNEQAEAIVFCGVHFMAETADILTEDHQSVILPDMRAGCSMADMANIRQTIRGWQMMQDTFGDTVLPLTYVNSTAAIKAFCGSRGGATVTSSNAKKMLSWAFTQKERILFLPDQHLGRNTAFELGVSLDEMAVWDPIGERFEYEGDLQSVKVILWKGHCSVHEKFSLDNIDDIRKKDPEVNIIVHPECSYEVVQNADYAGSTKEIIETIASAPKGSRWAVGTEMNLVNRLGKVHHDKEVFSLNPNMCPCLTMNRIDLPHLLWALDHLKQGKIMNRIKVEEGEASSARLALNRMLENV